MPFLLDFGLYMSFMTSTGIKDTELLVFATWPRAPRSARGVLSRGFVAGGARSTTTTKTQHDEVWSVWGWSTGLVDPWST